MLVADNTAQKVPKQLQRYAFKPGQSGNPLGRPRSARSKLSEDFIAALAADFEAHGAETIRIVRETKPEVFLRIVADLVPRDIGVNTDDAFSMFWELISSGVVSEA